MFLVSLHKLEVSMVNDPVQSNSDFVCSSLASRDTISTTSQFLNNGPSFVPRLYVRCEPGHSNYNFENSLRGWRLDLEKQSGSAAERHHCVPNRSRSIISSFVILATTMC